MMLVNVKGYNPNATNEDDFEREFVFEMITCCYDNRIDVLNNAFYTSVKECEKRGLEFNGFEIIAE